MTLTPLDGDTAAAELPSEVASLRFELCNRGDGRITFLGARLARPRGDVSVSFQAPSEAPPAVLQPGGGRATATVTLRAAAPGVVRGMLLCELSTGAAEFSLGAPLTLKCSDPDPLLKATAPYVKPKRQAPAAASDYIIKGEPVGGAMATRIKCASGEIPLR